MRKLLEQDDLAEAMPFDEADAPIAVWTLDDLEQSSDLGSVRDAWAHVDASNG